MRLLVHEIRSEGHHVPWAGMVLESLIDQVEELVFSHGGGEQLSMLRDLSPSVMSRITLHKATDQTMLNGRDSLAALVNAVRQVEPDRIFVNSIDDFASHIFRSAAMGIGAPRSLAGRLHGLYLRPRPLDKTASGLGIAIKRFGARRLFRQDVFSRIGLLDEFLEASLRTEAEIQTTWIPDFYRPLPQVDREEARAEMGIPVDRSSLLFFGVPHRRKGLDLAIEAFDRDGLGNAVLFVAGKLPRESDVRDRLAGLVEEGRAIVREGFVAESDIATVFAAADRVLIPYRKHYGSSSVLTLAAAAGRPVIASDHHLVGRRVVEHGLGVVHRDEDVDSLHEAIRTSIDAAPARIEDWRRGLEHWAGLNEVSRFRSAIREVAGLTNSTTQVFDRLAVRGEA
jgi:glycosyltransferase involved in cell wall biosynthesis